MSGRTQPIEWFNKRVGKYVHAFCPGVINGPFLIISKEAALYLCNTSQKTWGYVFSDLTTENKKS